jgi:hypothetical protein
VEESLEVREGGIERRLAQPLASLLAPLVCQTSLERNGLLNVEHVEVPVPCGLLETSNRFGDPINTGLTVTVCFLQVREVPVLDPFVVRVVRRHSPPLWLEVTIHDGLRGTAYVF